METKEVIFTFHIDTKNHNNHTLSPEIACEYYKLICEYKNILKEFNCELTTLPEQEGGRKFNCAIKALKTTSIISGTIGALTVGLFTITDTKTFQTFYRSCTQREWLDDVATFGKFLRQRDKTYSKIGSKDGELLINKERPKDGYICNFNNYILHDIDDNEDEDDITAKEIKLKEPIIIKSVKVGAKHINFVKTDKDILANRQEIIDFRNQNREEKVLNLFGVYE